MNIYTTGPKCTASTSTKNSKFEYLINSVT